MIALLAHLIVAAALIVGLWALPLWWLRSTGAADTYRRAYTRDRDQHADDVRESMQGRWAS